MRDGTNVRLGENCADVLADLHQGRLEQLDDGYHDDGGGGGDDDHQGQLRQLEVLLVDDQKEVKIEKDIGFHSKEKRGLRL